MGAHPLLVQRPERRAQADQRQSGDGREPADLPFFEWRASHGGKQPYAIAMKDGSPFGIAAIWENWKDPATGECASARQELAMEHDEKNDDFDPVRSDEDFDEDALERGSRLWLLLLIVIIGFLVAFGPVFFFR
jgi:hypothetical protein